MHLVKAIGFDSWTIESWVISSYRTSIVIRFSQYDLTPLHFSMFVNMEIKRVLTAAQKGHNMSYLAASQSNLADFI